MTAEKQQAIAEPEIPLTQLSAGEIDLHGQGFIDHYGRFLHLRGANVGASSKVPINPQQPFDQARNASYVNRPFPLKEAAEHWRRLKSWGLTLLRINVTWDAIEHAGPRQYDEEYLSYLRNLLASMREYGLVAYVVRDDFVQPGKGVTLIAAGYTSRCLVSLFGWSASRCSFQNLKLTMAQSGAPAWTLEAVGFDLSNNGEKIAETGAAFLDGVRGGRLEGERGLWPTGYQKLAAATMNTVFWGGKTFTPSLQIEGVNAETYLQNAFIGAYEKLVGAVGDLDTVIGFEMMNEPHPGFIGLPSIHEWNYNTDLHLGAYPSPLQAFAAGSGHPTTVPYYVRSFPYPTKQSTTNLLNLKGVSAWSPSGPSLGECIWQKEGVWRWSNDKKKAVALQEQYFLKGRKGKPVEFYNDFYFPFVEKWESMIRRKLTEMRQARKFRMVGCIPNEYCPEWPESSRPERMVFAPHWYDLNALFKKQAGNVSVNVQGLARGMFVLRALYWGESGVKNNYALQIRNSVANARKQLGEMPIVFGECGIPIDLNKEEAYRSGNWSWPLRLMDAMICALEASSVGFNLWTYNPSNTRELGDDWNAEDFSIYSEADRLRTIASTSSDSSDLDAGGRLLDAVVRPYAIATSGTPLSSAYDRHTGTFTLRYRSPIRGPPASPPPPTATITEIFLPRRVYTQGQIEFTMTTGGRARFDWERERLFVWFEDGAIWPNEKERVRRIDIWIKRKEVERSLWITVLVVIMVPVLVGLLTWQVQLQQWRQEAKVGIPGTDWIGFLEHARDTLAKAGRDAWAGKLEL